MSYILDALRKADQERNIGDVPDLDTPHWSQRRGGHTRYWVWGAIGLLIVNGALFAYLFSNDESVDTGPELASHVPEPPQSKPMVTPPGLESIASTKPPQPENLPLKPLARPEHKVITKPRQPVPVVAERQAGVEISPAVVPAIGSVEPVDATTTPAVEKPRVPVRVQTGEPEIPEWGELSLEFRSGFNPPRMDVHVYADEPSRRFILVDLKRFVEGDTLSSGAKLEKILPQGVQLYYGGTRFRYDR